jgi:hypothetical protein
MATKKSVAGDRLGYVYTGGSLTKQPLILTATTATQSGAGGVVKNIAIITVTPGGGLAYVAVSREFLQAQKDNKSGNTAGGKQLTLDDKYSSVDINKFATTAELTALGITAWTDTVVITTVTDFSVAGVATAKLGYDKYNHGTEITGFDYSDTTEADTAQATADAEADSKAKRQKTYMIIIGVILALILIFGFATDWKFSFKKEETQEHDGKHDKDKKDKKD